MRGERRTIRGFVFDVRNIPQSAHDALCILASSNAVKQIIVFGSRAVGDHEERSDVDLAIVAPELTQSELAVLRDRINSANTLYRISISPLEKMPSTLKERVLYQGITVYER